MRTTRVHAARRPPLLVPRLDRRSRQRSKSDRKSSLLLLRRSFLGGRSVGRSVGRWSLVSWFEANTGEDEEEDDDDDDDHGVSWLWSIARRSTDVATLGRVVARGSYSPSLQPPHSLRNNPETDEPPPPPLKTTLIFYPHQSPDPHHPRHFHRRHRRRHRHSRHHPFAKDQNNKNPLFLCLHPISDSSVIRHIPGHVFRFVRRNKRYRYPPFAFFFLFFPLFPFIARIIAFYLSSDSIEALQFLCSSFRESRFRSISVRYGGVNLRGAKDGTSLDRQA